MLSTDQLKTFPEDHLTLLGKPVLEETPESYHARILGFYAPKTSSGEEVKIKGKRLQTATKKRQGLYEMRFPTAMGEMSAQFEFSKDLLVAADLDALAKKLMTSIEKVREHLQSKNFVLAEESACSPNGADVTPTTETNPNASPS